MKVLKKNLAEETTWQYEGRIVERGERFVVLEAFFNRDDMLFHGVLWKRNDRFIETFYADRWYNVFEIRDRDDDALKGWYCNVCKPAVITDDAVSYVDLALDLWVTPDGQQVVLDEDEFAALNLDAALQRQARAGLRAVQEKFAAK